MELFAKLINEGLENKDLTQTQLVEIVNTHRKNINAYANNVNEPDLEMMLKISIALDLDLLATYIIQQGLSPKPTRTLTKTDILFIDKFSYLNKETQKIILNLLDELNKK